MQPCGFVQNQVYAQFEIGAYRNFVYLVLDWGAKKAAVIDPQVDVTVLLDVLETNGFSLEAVLITHSHPDHVAGVPALLKRFPSLPVFVHALEMRRLSGFFSEKAPEKAPEKAVVRLIQDREVLSVGSLHVMVLHTPGHSAGECCFFVDGSSPILFTGDTVFVRDCGRTDFSTGSAPQMFESLQRLKKLPPQTLILPGHHYAPECTTTLERELKESPPLLCRTVEELERLP